MFHRRLVLLGTVTACALVALGGQALRLATGKHVELRQRAESKLLTSQWTATVRGRILDRKGRVLAQDRPSYAVAASYAVVSGEWAVSRAQTMAKRAFRHQWPELSAAQRSEIVERFRGVYEQHVARAWSTIADAAGVGVADLDKARAAIVDRVERQYERVVQHRRDQLVKDLVGEEEDQPHAVTGSEYAKKAKRLDEPIREMSIPHVILRHLPDTVGLSLDVIVGDQTELTLGENDAGETVVDRVERLPGVKVIDSGDREYPLEDVELTIDRTSFPGPMAKKGSGAVTARGVGVQLLGWMRDVVHADDIERREGLLAKDEGFKARVSTDGGADRGAYTEIDRVGAAGVEASSEADLRGLRGLRVRQLDTGTTSLTAATPGRDVQLTLDAMLQARVQAVMSPEMGLAVVHEWSAGKPTTADGKPNPAYRAPGTVLHGAAVVLDIDTGDVLALVSTPTFTRAALRENPDAIFEDRVNNPLINKAINRAYTPGSIAKACVLNGAGKRGVYHAGDTVECNGFYFPKHENQFRCWIFKMTQGSSRMTHTQQLGHALSAPEGLMVSCNIFFFTMGNHLGVEGIRATYTDFGVGTTWGLGVGAEAPGSVARIKGLQVGDAMQMGIGQGAVAWTPMHAADAYATLARRGVKLRPRMVMGRVASEPVDLGLNSDVLNETFQGLEWSVNAPLGSGNHIRVNNEDELTFNAPGVTVWGKTGTAAAHERIDPDGPGPEPMVDIEGDHAWYVFLAGKTADRRPRYAVSVLMEWAGSGGKIAGPIANQIVHALIAEGYL